MAASTTLSSISLPFHHCHISQHVDVYPRMRDIVEHHYRHERRSSMRYHQQHDHPRSTLRCRCMHGRGAEAEGSFGKWASEWDAWRALEEQLEAFRGEFPDGAAVGPFQALVEQLDETADPANQQMQMLLGQAKRFLRCPRASLVHYLNLVRHAEEAGHPQLGAWYLETGHACREAGDLEGALHFCSKALEAFMDRFGPGSLRAAQARSGLSKAYFGLARYEDAMREGEAAMPVLKKSGGPEEVISLELTLADTFFNLKRYNEVVSILEEVINSTTGVVHVNANITTARAFSALGRNADAKAHCVKAFDALEVQEPSAQVAAHYVMLGSMYEQQEDYEQMALVLTKSIKMYEKFPQNSPQEFIAELEGELGRVLLRISNSEEALPYLERHLSKKKTSVGSELQNEGKEAQELLHAHYYLGAAYSQCEKFHKALEHFEACMVLLSDVCKGENPSFVMTIYNNAASMYYHIDRLERAIQCQQAAVDVIKKNRLRETNATRRIEELLGEYLQEANSPQ